MKHIYIYSIAADLEANIQPTTQILPSIPNKNILSPQIVKFKIQKNSQDENSDFTGVQYPGNSEYTETEFIRFCKALRMIEVQRLRERYIDIFIYVLCMDIYKCIYMY
jgi:hypothetical protein